MLKPEDKDTGESNFLYIVPAQISPHLDNQTAVGRLISKISHIWTAFVFQADHRNLVTPSFSRYLNHRRKI